MPFLRRSIALAVTAITLAAGGLACSSDSPSSSPCQDLQTLAGQVRDLPKATFTSSGSDDLENQIDEIDATLDDLKSSGDEAFGDDVEALKSGFSDLGDAITDSGSLSATSDDVQSALSDITDAWQQLARDAKNEFSDCDLSTSGS